MPNKVKWSVSFLKKWDTLNQPQQFTAMIHWPLDLQSILSRNHDCYLLWWNIYGLQIKLHRNNVLIIHIQVTNPSKQTILSCTWTTSSTFLIESLPQLSHKGCIGTNVHKCINYMSLLIFSVIHDNWTIKPETYKLSSALGHMHCTNCLLLTNSL